MSWNVFVTRPIPQPGIDILTDHCSRVDINADDRVLTKEELLREVKGRDGVLCLLTDTIDEEVLNTAQGVGIFANHAVGFNNININAATRLGIMVTNTPGVLTDATADLTWALILATARRIAESDRFTRDGKYKGWGPMLMLGNAVSGTTLGIVGAGRIGTAVAMRSVGFNMRILYTDTVPNETMEKALRGDRVTLEELLGQSDFVTLHVPLLPETTHLIGSRELELMKKTAFLINTCRGPVVNEKALVNALRSETIAGAALDVYENEPELEPGLTEQKNIVLVPHIGSATVTARTKMAVIAAENLIAGLKGDRPPNLVNPEVLEDKKT